MKRSEDSCTVHCLSVRSSYWIKRWITKRKEEHNVWKYPSCNNILHKMEMNSRHTHSHNHKQTHKYKHIMNNTTYFKAKKVILFLRIQRMKMSISSERVKVRCGKTREGQSIKVSSKKISIVYKTFWLWRDWTSDFTCYEKKIEDEYLIELRCDSRVW